MEEVKDKKEQKALYKDHVRKVLKGNHAAAEAAKLCRSGFIPAYPITPQTSIVEELSEKVASGNMDATFINLDSEHSVFAAAMGAALAGERVFTATSGQGLFYAHEVLHAIAHFRLPIVICNVGRPSIPWNIWSDQTDSLSQRDTGWVQIYGESSQEVIDTIIQSYVLAEKYNLPVMVVLDAFYQSHTSEVVWIPSQSLVDAFLPPKTKGGDFMDMKNPRSFGGLVPPGQYDFFNYRHWDDINKVEEDVNRVGEDFEQKFGRKYTTVEAVNITEKTEIVLVTLSTITTTVRGVLSAFPEVGLLKIRLFRPFPVASVQRALSVLNPEARVVTIDRNYLGTKEGALMQEMKIAFGNSGISLYGIYAGLGGRDVPPETIAAVIQYVKGTPEEVHWIDIEK